MKPVSLFANDETNDADLALIVTRDEPSATVARLRPVPSVLRNIHIVMIGDSVTRYQYLSLAYRLRHGVWFHKSHWKHDLVNEQTFKSPFHDQIKAEFLFQTNNILQPMEVCDCFSGKRKLDHVENRYFYDPVLNNSIVFLTGYGNQPMKGRILPEQLRNQSDLWRMESMRKPARGNLWSYHDWAHAIVNYIRHLDPPPRHMVMNAGRSKHRFGRRKQGAKEGTLWSDYTQSLLEAMENATGLHFVWKTTTFGVHGHKAAFERDEVMCNLLHACLNLSFTQHVRSDLYWDQFHFKEPVYRAANEQMLDLLGYLPKEYSRLDLAKILLVETDETDTSQGSSNGSQLADPLQNAEPETTSATIYDDKAVVLRDIHIVMIGDSLMRYQYLSLAYRLRHGVWFNESLWHYNLVKQGTFKSPLNDGLWGEFLLHSNNVLHPLELCDCYRQPLPFDVVENRYYYDPLLNNSVVYLNAFGHWRRPMKGRILPHQVHEEWMNRSSIFRTNAFRERMNLVWNYSDWADTILNYVRYLNPRPTYIVMNAGIWKHRFCVSRHSKNGTMPLLNNNQATSLSNDTKNLQRAMELVPEFQFVWRTTTFDEKGESPEFECDDVMCQLLPTCVNVSFTQSIKSAMYWDPVHFLEPVYRLLNEIMLGDLRYLPKGYVKFNISALLK